MIKIKNECPYRRNDGSRKCTHRDNKYGSDCVYKMESNCPLHEEWDELNKSINRVEKSSSDAFKINPKTIRE